MVVTIHKAKDIYYIIVRFELLTNPLRGVHWALSECENTVQLQPTPEPLLLSSPYISKPRGTKAINSELEGPRKLRGTLSYLGIRSRV